MTKGKAILITIAGSLAAGGGIGYWYYNKQLQILKESFKIKPIKIQLGRFSGDSAELLLALRIESQSNLDAEILDYSASIVIQGENIANISLDKNQFADASFAKTNILPAKGYSDIHLIVSFDPQKIVGQGWSIIKGFANSRDLLIELRNSKGTIKTGFIKMSVPIDYQTTLMEILSPTQ